jgi:hypothetical protein
MEVQGNIDNIFFTQPFWSRKMTTRRAWSTSSRKTNAKARKRYVTYRHKCCAPKHEQKLRTQGITEDTFATYNHQRTSQPRTAQRRNLLALPVNDPSEPWGPCRTGGKWVGDAAAERVRLKMEVANVLLTELGGAKLVPLVG